MVSKPPLPEDTTLPDAVNGWVHDPESNKNGHAWYDQGRETSVGVFSGVGVDEAYVKVADERVHGFARGEIVARVEYDEPDATDGHIEVKRSAAAEAVEQAVSWMEWHSPADWSCDRVSEPMFTPPVKFDLEVAYVSERDTTLYYQREDYDVDEWELDRSNPREYAHEHRPYLYIHVWAGSGNATVALAPWKHAHGPETKHPEVVEIVETPEECGLDVALKLSREWAAAEYGDTPAETARDERVGQTGLDQWASTDGGTVTEQDASPRVLTVISCGDSKQDLDDGETVPARELYTSSVHTCKDRYARHSHAYYIASAKFGLVHHDEELPEYDQRLSDLAAAEQRAWAAGVVTDLQAAVDEHAVDAVVLVGGAEYTDRVIEAAEEQGLQVPLYAPWQALDSITGNGRGMAWCNEEANWPVNLDRLDPAVLGAPRTDPDTTSSTPDTETAEEPDSAEASVAAGLGRWTE